MKRTAAHMGQAPHLPQSAVDQPSELPRPAPARSYRNLDTVGAGRMAMELLNLSPPDKQAFALLLDEMHEQGIRTLKLSGELSQKGYDALVSEFSCHRFRLEQHIKGLDFSDTQLPQISTLLKLLSASTHLESLNLANTRFPASKGDTTKNQELLPLQPAHLQLIANIVENNKKLKVLNLSDQPWLGSTVGLTHALVAHRDAPMYRLMEACRSSGIEVLKLCRCNLSDLDVDNIRTLLESEAHTSLKPSLRELDLKGNYLASYPWENFAYSIKGHKSLETLSLPDEAGPRWNALSAEKQSVLVQMLQSCPQLKAIEPESLAGAQGIYALLLQRNAEVRQMQLMSSVLVFRHCCPQMSTDILGLTITATAKFMHMNPEEALPARLRVTLPPKDAKTVPPAAQGPADNPL